MTDGASGTPVPGALVRVDADGREQRILSDSTGAYRLCLPAGPAPVRLAAVPPEAVLTPLDRVGARTVARPAPGFVHADVALAVRRDGRSAARAGRSYTTSNAILGRIVDGETKAGVAAAMVTLVDSSGAVVRSGITGDDGRFRLVHPGRGRAFTLRVEHVGYAAAEGPVAFAPAQELRVEVTLSARAIPLDPIVVTERRRGLLVDVGYYDRREHRVGLGIDRDEIERRSPVRLTDLFQGHPGLRVVRMGQKSDLRVVTARRLNGKDCQPSIWLDGTQVRSGGEPRMLGGEPVDVAVSDVATPGEVEAIEFFDSPAQLPVQFGGSSAACGVLVVWTRRK